MDKKQALLLAIIVLGSGVIILGYLYDNKETEIIEEPQAMLNAELLMVYENLYNAEEMFFSYRVDNYGDIEAKEVNVRCKILNENDEVQVSVLDSIGNIASNSVELGEAIFDSNLFNFYEEGTNFCYVESCDDCEILYKNIPKLMEWYHP